MRFVFFRSVKEYEISIPIDRIKYVTAEECKEGTCFIVTDDRTFHVNSSIDEVHRIISR